MEQRITAIYQRGVLHPLTAPPLNEGEIVHLWVLAPAGEDLDENQRALYALMAAGLVRPVPPHPEVQPVPEKRRQELAQILGAAGPLSDLVIEDRG